MAKTMALLRDNIVVNLEWHRDDKPETDTLKDIGDHPVDFGDTYKDGKFYRNGEVILTPLEASEKAYSDLLEETDAMLVDYEYRLSLMELGLTEE